MIASLLIIQRVADKSAFTSNTITHVSAPMFRVRGQGESTDDSGEYPMGFASKSGTTSGEVGVGVETVINVRQDKVCFPTVTALRSD